MIRIEVGLINRVSSMKNAIVFFLLVMSFIFSPSLAHGEVKKIKENILIQQLAKADWQIWKMIWLEALQKNPLCFASCYEELVGKDDEYWQKFCSKNILFCALCDGKVVGCVGFEVYGIEQMKHKGRLFSLYVNPDYRGKGIARNLINAVIEYAKTCVEQLICGVLSTNISVMGLYEEYGFRKYGTEPRALKMKNGSYADIMALVLFLKRC